MTVDEFISSHSSQPIYIDSNIFLYTIFRDNKFFTASYNLLRNLEENHIHGVISFLVIDEVSYKLIIETIKSTYKITSFSKVFKEIEKHPAILEITYPPLLGFYTIISHYKGLKIAALDNHKYQEIFHNITGYHLLPRDAWHLAIMQQEGIKFIATNDHHFRNIPEITCITP